MRNTGVRWSFWVIGTVALVWNTMGAANFLVQMNPDALAAYPEAERAIIANRPLWATTGFAVGVFGGALGSVLLLLRKSAALFVFALSLLGVIVATFHAFTATGAFTAAALAPPLSALIVAAFLVWYSGRAARAGRLG